MMRKSFLLALLLLPAAFAPGANASPAVWGRTFWMILAITLLESFPPAG